ncbi:hypothetical protein F0562_016475 [Nyssa sinensis]|uniref:Uncharacterized protein n=1 Tax=Nyssa sinensis TaxID=561372 RepID=A0A5J4ZNV2_9ASTE|nr:hypothetical protein F0562_016475 [Nyssa sinensis]
MATRKSHVEKKSYIYFEGREGDNSITSDNQFEFDEADVWNSNEIVPSEAKKSIPNSRSSKKPTKRGGGAIDRRPIAAATSLPVNIPDWSKILRDEHNKNPRRESDDDDDDDDDQDDRMPPHVFLARTRTASLSVHEEDHSWM